jgi:hypothetical protein
MRLNMRMFNLLILRTGSCSRSGSLSMSKAYSWTNLTGSSRHNVEIYRIRSTWISGMYYSGWLNFSSDFSRS